MFSKISLFPVACLIGQTFAKGSSFATVHFSTKPSKLGKCVYEESINGCQQKYHSECWEKGGFLKDKHWYRADWKLENTTECDNACANKTITKYCVGYNDIISREGESYLQKCQCPPDQIPATTEAPAITTSAAPVTPVAPVAPVAPVTPVTSKAPTPSSSVHVAVTDAVTSPTDGSASSVTVGVISLALVFTNTV
eukprot:Pgem_evm1s7254